MNRGLSNVTIMLLELLILSVFVLWLYQRWYKRDVYKLAKELNSQLLSLPILGHSYLFLGDNTNRMKALQTIGYDALNNDNGLSCFWHGSFLYTMVADPESAELILKTCLEKDDIVKMMRFFVGNGLIFAPVSIWRPRRKILALSFGTVGLRQFMTIFVKQSRVLVEQMNKVTGAGPVSGWNFFTAYTMDTIAETTLGYEMKSQNSTDQKFQKTLDAGLADCAERLLQPWLHSDLVYHNLPVYSKLLKDRVYLWDVVIKLIKSKRKEMKEKCQRDENPSDGNLKSIMELLITSSGGDAGYTDDEVKEETMVVMIAGNDTTAVGASFISVMLSRYPAVQEKVYQELQEVFGNSDRTVTFEDLPHLKYLDAVIRETLRLYPPVPVITRKVEKYVELPSGIRLVPGTGVVIHIWAIHRNPRYWGDDAEQFRPERFLDAPLQHPAAFIPFSNGPRNCVGYQFAMTSMKTLMSTLLRRYRILPATQLDENSEHPPIKLKYDIMMKDENAFKILVEPRVK